MDINLLVKLMERAWALDILAVLNAGVPARQAPLIAATGAGRTAFGQSLEHLIALGVLERNPGHGHPLRPEFRLTATGARLAPMADAILDTVPGAGEQALLRRRWTVPVLAVAHTPRRFSDLKAGLGKITDRALSQSVDHLQDRGWIIRDVDPTSRPLRPWYHAANDGRRISQIVHAQGLRAP